MDGFALGVEKALDQSLCVDIAGLGTIYMKRSTTGMSLQAAAIAFGVSRETLLRRLEEAGQNPRERGSRWTVIEIHKALARVGDLEAARYRETSARAELLEIDVRKAGRELVPLADVVGVVNAKLAPVRAALMAVPATLGPKANPADPTLGIEAVAAWRDGFLRYCQNIKVTDAAGDLDEMKPTRKRIRGREPRKKAAAGSVIRT